MADVVIGRLSLKVYPDTSEFRKRAQAEADAIEKKLKPIKMKVELDSDDAVREAGNTNQKLERELDDVQVKTTLDTDEATQEAKTFKERMKKSIKDIAVNLNLNSGEAMAEMAATMKMLQATAQDIHIQMQIDAANAKAVFQEVLDRLDPPEVAVHTEVHKPSLIKTLAKLKAAIPEDWFTDIKFKPIKDPFAVLTRSTGLRLLMDMHKEKFKSFANLDKVAMKVGALGLAFQSLGGVLTATTGNLLSWGRDLGSIARIALPLPGILAGIGLAAWNMKVAFADAGKYLPKFKSQWEALQKSMSKNFWAQAQKPMQTMIDKLFPKFERGMKSVSTQLGKFTGELAKGFTASLGGRLDGMMGNLATSIQIAARGAKDLANGLSILVDFGMKQLPALADAFVDLTTDFNTFMMTSENNGNLQKWTNEAVTNLKALGSVVWDTGRLLAGLGSAAAAAGASTLQTLADTMNRAADVVSSGPFQAALTSFLSDVYKFSDAVGAAVGRAVSQIATELGPMFGKSLAALGPTLAASIDALFRGLTAPASVTNFASFFEGLRQGLANLQPAFDVLGQKVSAVFSILGTAFKNLSLIVGSFVQELAVIIGYVQKPLEDLMNALGPSMKANLDAIKPAIDGIGQAFATVLGALKPVADSLGSLKVVIAPLAEIIGNVAKMVANFLKPIFEQWGAMLPELAASLGLLMDKFKFLSQFLPTIGTVFGAVFSIISTIVLGTIKTLIDGINNVIDGIINVISGLLKIVTGDMEGFKQVFFGILQTIVGAFQVWTSVTMIGILRGGLVKILSLWKAGWTSVQTAARSAWAAILNVIKNGTSILYNAVVSVINRVKAVWNAGWSIVRTTAEKAWSGLKTGANSLRTAISDAFTGIVSFVRTKTGELPGIIRSKVGEMVAAGAALIEGLKQGIVSKAQEAVGAVRDLASQAANAVKSIWEINSPSKLFRRIAASIPEGVAQGISRNASTAVSAAEAMAKAVGSVPMEMNDVVAPDMGKLKTATVGAMGMLDGADVGPSTVINQTFNNSNVDAEESYRRLRFAVQQAKMSPRFGEAV